ncbi:hypothetical protein D3C78_1383670 [compost metagenome]
MADLLTGQAQFESQFTALVRLWACQWIDGHFVDQFRSFFRNFLDFNATLGGCHEHHATAGTVNNRTQIQFFIDVGRRFYQDLVNRLAQRVSLVGHQTLAQPGFSESADIFFAVYNFNAASFTATASMNLTFNHPRAGADFGCGLFRFTRCGTGITGWCRHTIPSKQLFCLIFV